MVAGEALGLLSDGALGGDVNAGVGALGLQGGVQLAQRFDTVAGGLPAARADQRYLAFFCQAQVGSAFDALDVVAGALPGVLQSVGKVAPWQSGSSRRSPFVAR